MSRNELDQVQHPVELLPDLAAGRPVERQSEIARHVATCDSCGLELKAWQQLAEAARDEADSQAATIPSGLAAAIADRVADEAKASIGYGGFIARLAWLGRFIAAQVPLVRREIWPASAVIMAIGAGISLLGTGGSAPGSALSLFAPLAAAVGIALIYGQENDPALELALATPTSPRIVVVARLVVVVAWDLALALVASLLLALADGPAVFLPLVSLWLGPMLVLGCLTLLLSLVTGSGAAIGIAAVIWTLRAYELANPANLDGLPPLTTLLDAIWQTTPLTLTAAALLLIVAVVAAPLRDGISPRAV